MVRIVILTNDAAVVKHWSRPVDNIRGYNSRLRQAPRTMPLIAKPTNGRPMSINTSGHGFVSKAENTQMVAYSTNKNANQQTSATFKPATALVALGRPINHARA